MVRYSQVYVIVYGFKHGLGLAAYSLIPIVFSLITVSVNDSKSS